VSSRYGAEGDSNDSIPGEARMTNGFTTALTELRDVLRFAPDWAVAAVLFAIAVIAALTLHQIAVAILTRALSAQHPMLQRIVIGTRGPSRLALLLFALAVTVPAAPVDDNVGDLLSKLLLLTTIGLLGWMAITAIHIAADLYLMRFRIDVADNLLARKHVTQMRILLRAADTLVTVVTVGFALMTFESVRQYGISLFASAGVAGLVIGLALRPLLSNLLAGVQLAITQPIRIDDVVIVENEWGWIEEITSTYVVVRIWDLRRLIVPLTYFIEKPFQNWTRENAAILGPVILHLDYRAPIDAIREQAKAICEASPDWDRKVCGVQVTDTRESTIEVRVLVSASTAGQAWNLRCEMREKLIAFLQREHPQALPRRRLESVAGQGPLFADPAPPPPPPRDRSAGD
jgi:small-conductance mechanosensitive channel